MRAQYEDVRSHILDAGRRIIAAKGFEGVGLNEILRAAGVPKGSFYHYFPSKEGYGRALLDRYVETYLERIETVLGAEGVPARDRLMRFWSIWASWQSSERIDEKCLVVKLSAEVADLSDDMRRALEDGTRRVIQRLARCMADGVADGSLPADLAPAASAERLYMLWLGASLLTKLRRNPSALDAALAETRALLTPI
ncbi:MAG TPA: TetR/AcrR family transcriptional regulator [Aliidongia sp.]|nr:TetR/AcrR family transcriptional regulator [Aliidongia sp.]